MKRLKYPTKNFGIIYPFFIATCSHRPQNNNKKTPHLLPMFYLSHLHFLSLSLGGICVPVRSDEPTHLAGEQEGAVQIPVKPMNGQFQTGMHKHGYCLTFTKEKTS